MSATGRDPYAVLGVASDASDRDLRRAYRALVKQHHPDHNGGSAESAVRFAEIQDAYAQVRERGSGATAQKPRARQSEAAAASPDVEQRIRDMERDVAAAAEEKLREQRRRAAVAAQAEAARQRAAYEAVAAAQRRPTREQLGYYTTDDSFTKIVDDAAEQLGERLRAVDSSLRSAEGRLQTSEVKRQFARRLTDLFSDRD